MCGVKKENRQLTRSRAKLQQLRDPALSSVDKIERCHTIVSMSELIRFFFRNADEPCLASQSLSESVSYSPFSAHESLMHFNPESLGQA
jgi:hypothetical protein